MDACETQEQYKDSRHLRSRGNLHARYATRNWFDWVADHLNILSGDEIVDVGCGAGWFWLSATKGKSDIRLTLVDNSSGMVNEASDKLAANTSLKLTNNKVADAIDLPLTDRSFDKAIAMHMLYHVLDPAIAVGELVRVTRTGGLVAITTNADNNLHELFDLGNKIFGGSSYDPAAAVFGLGMAQEMLSDHLENVTVHEFEDTYLISEAADIYQYLTSFPPGINSSDDERLSAQDAISRYLAENNGVLKVKRLGGLVCGTK